MNTKMTESEFSAHVEAYTMSVIKADSDKYAHVDRAVDASGCTSAVAVYEGGRASYIHYNNINDCNEYIVADGVVWPCDQYDGDAAEINSNDAVRVYAVDEESALALAKACDQGQRNPDNTTLGEPGIVQAICA